MSSKNLKVVGDINPNQAREIEQLRTAFEIMGNRFVAIKAQVGFDIKGSELNEDTPIPSYAPANDRMGFETMGDFISALGIDWTDWTEEVKAHEIRERFNVTGASDKAVIVQYNDICKYLGREPYNAEDYHHNKDEMTRGVINRLEALNDRQKEEHEVVVSEYENKINNMNKEIGNYQASVNTLTQEKEELIKEREEVKFAHQTQLNQARSDFESQLTVHAERAATEKATALSMQESELTKKFETELSIKIHDLNKEIEAQKAEISRLNAELNQLKAESVSEIQAVIQKHQEEIAILSESHKQDISKNYVPRFDHQAALLKLDQETKNVMSLMAKEVSFESERETMQSQIDELEISLDNYKNTYNELNTKVLDGTVTSTDLDIQRITEILNSHESIVYRLERYKESAKKRKQSIETKNTQLRKKDKKISALKEKVETASKKEQKSSVLSWILGLSLIGAGSYATYLSFMA